jgi:molybdate transport system regulatory protein
MRQTISKPSAKFRLRVSTGDAIAVGPGKIALIEAIQETGSITAAAKSLGMSYRRAWMLVDQLNTSLKQPAIRSAIGGERGGGSELTDVGIELVRLYRRIEERATKACAAELKSVMSLIAR